MADYLEKIREINWKQTDRLAPVVLVLIILYLCWKLAALFWLLIAPPQAMQLDRVELGSQQTQVPNISSFALFQENRSSAADAQLNMVLQGVVVGQPSRYSSAVIKVNESSDRYLVGETIQGSSYQLAEVYTRLAGSVEKEAKTIEQRVRRAITKALQNVASMGVEDYYNERFQTYSTALFDFKEVRQEMDYSNGKSCYRGKINVKKFIEGTLFIANEG